MLSFNKISVIYSSGIMHTSHIMYHAKDFITLGNTANILHASLTPGSVNMSVCLRNLLKAAE